MKHFLLNLQIARGLVIRLHVVTELEIGLRMRCWQTKFGKCTLQQADTCDWRTLRHLAWEFTVKRARFGDIGYLLIGVEHACS